MPKPVECGIFLRCPKSGRRIGLNMRPWWAKIFLPVFGLLALVWYLLRVIPKPVRATYPCMQVAAPLASGFIGWLLGLGVVAGLVRWSTKAYQQSRGRVLAACCAFALIGAGLHLVIANTGLNTGTFTPIDAANTPMGTGIGIFPGRVTWVHDPTATRWDGSTGYWWEPHNTDQAAIDAMLADTVCALTGEGTADAAWNALFRFYNQNHGKGSTGFAAGEKIVIKANLNSGGGTSNKVDASPHIAHALFDHLVNIVGVPQTDIVIYDAQRTGISAIQNYCSPDFPNVKYNEWGSWLANQIAYSSPEVTSSNARRLPSAVVNADYLINFACLKRHCRIATSWSNPDGQTAITVCAKNHFGTIGSPSALHATIHDWHRGMGSYNNHVDIIGSRHLGGKTLLYLVDGLYSGDRHSSTPKRWDMAPFNGHWPSSIMASLDPVAIDSVALDFLRWRWDLVANADNYLHEAAQVGNPPSGIDYKPDGVKLTGSLGVHEHWNNPIDKEYSGNQGGNGIELYPIYRSLESQRLHGHGGHAEQRHK